MGGLSRVRTPGGAGAGAPRPYKCQVILLAVMCFYGGRKEANKTRPLRLAEREPPRAQHPPELRETSSWEGFPILSAVQFSSVAQSCLTLWDPMDCSTPGLLVYHQLPELAQTHVHRVSEAIQPSHLLLSPSPPAFNLSQHGGLFQ